MKIAQIAPLIESVPPCLYGGTERIASYLTEELVRLGHGVTLFAIEDSITNAELAPCCTIAMASSHDQALALSQLRGAWAPATPHSRRPSWWSRGGGIGGGDEVLPHQAIWPSKCPVL